MLRSIEMKNNFYNFLKFIIKLIFFISYYHSDPKYLIEMNVGIAKNFERLGMYSESNEYYELVRKLLLLKNDKNIMMGNLYINIAENFRKMNDASKALKNYKAGKKIYEKLVANDHRIIQKINKTISELENKD